MAFGLSTSNTGGYTLYAATSTTLPAPRMMVRTHATCTRGWSRSVGYTAIAASCWGTRYAHCRRCAGLAPALYSARPLQQAQAALAGHQLLVPRDVQHPALVRLTQGAGVAAGAPRAGFRVVHAAPLLTLRSGHRP